MLVDADAYGKHLFVRFDDGRTLHAHLLLTGSFEVGRVSREPEWKRRIELWMEDGRLTGVSVPLLEVMTTADEHTITDALGPDLCALAGPPDLDEVTARLVRDRDAPLAGALLDQRNVAGFGNVYANDLPFIAGISPYQPIGAIDGLVDLVAIGTALIRLNVANGSINTTGRRLGTGDHWVHGLGRGRCPVCGTTLDYPRCRLDALAAVDHLVSVVPAGGAWKAAGRPRPRPQAGRAPPRRTRAVLPASAALSVTARTDATVIGLCGATAHRLSSGMSVANRQRQDRERVATVGGHVVPRAGSRAGR